MKKFFSILLAACMMISSISFTVAADTVSLFDESEIHITSAQDLIQMASDIQSDAQGGAGKVYYLDNDISLDNMLWSANIGVKGHPFRGTFDGQGHVIKDFTLSITDELPYGIFGAVAGSAQIKNVGVENGAGTAANWTHAIGGLIGEAAENATVESCYAKNITIDATTTYGYAKRGGGLIGLVDGSGINVKNCYAIGCAMEDGEVDEDGGLIGGIHAVAQVENCYSNTLLARCKEEGLKSKVVNSYYVDSPHWPQECYAGERITADQLKDMAADLGSAYTADTAAANNGYPILSWQKDSRLDDGEASIVSTSLESGEEVGLIGTEIEVLFDKYIDKTTVKTENIQISPAISFTVTPGSASSSDSIRIALDTLQLDTAYTITFLDGFKTLAGFSVADGENITFRTVKTMPAFQITRTTPEDGAANVSVKDFAITAVFNNLIDFAALTDNAVTVTPSASYRVEKGSAENELKVVFTEELRANTDYTVEFTNQIISLTNMAAVPKSVHFKTEKGFSNLVDNGNMENTALLSVFDDKNRNESIMFADETERTGSKNYVLKFSPAWGDQPVITKTSIQKAGVYRMSAWVKTEEAQEVAMAFWCGGDNWDTRKHQLNANEWYYLSEEFTVTSPNMPEEISIRSVGQKVMYIDDWSIYDVGLAPDRTPQLRSSGIENGATEVSTISPAVDLEFDTPIRFDTMLSGITVTPNNKIEKVLFDVNDALRCTVQLGNLDPNTQYTLTLNGVRDFKGKALTGSTAITFTTVTVKETDAKVVSTTPTDGQTGISCTDATVSITFDSPMDPATFGYITVTPDAGAKVVPDAKDIKKCTITLDGSKMQKGTQYTVTVPDRVMTINGQKTTPYTFRFTTVTIAELVQMVNAALGNPDEMKTAIESVYSEMDALETYDYVKNQLPQQMTAFYTAMANGSRLADLSALTDAMNACAFSLILNHVSDASVIETMIVSVLNEGTAAIFSDAVLTSDASRSEIVNYAMTNKDQSYEKLYAELITQVICKPFDTLRGAEGIEKLLKLAKDNFTGSDSISTLLDTIDAKTNPAAYYKKLQGITPKSLADIKAALTNAINTTGDSTSGGNGGGSSGGGGGRGNSGLGGGSSAGGSASNAMFYGNEPQNQEAFVDLSEALWAKDSILKLYHMGIINGKGNRRFAPNDILTRAEFAKIAVMVNGGSVENASVDFVDLSTNDWSYPYVASAYQKELIHGIGDRRFGGDMSITREDMAVILLRMLQSAGIGIESGNVSFTDESDISDYAKDAVSVLNQMGMIRGVGDGKFDPKGITTRAQAAVVFDRFLDVCNRNETGGNK